MSYRMKGSTFFQKPDDLKYWERWLKSRGATTKPAGMGSLDPESGYRVGNWLLRDPKDIEVPVTSIVDVWNNDTIPNNGFLVKLSGSAEFNTSKYEQPILQICHSSKYLHKYE